jgi:hypothetical protein
MAPADVDHLPGDPARLLRGQEDDHVRDVVRAPDPIPARLLPPVTTTTLSRSPGSIILKPPRRPDMMLAVVLSLLPGAWHAN